MPVWTVLRVACKQGALTCASIPMCLQSPMGPMGQFLYSVYVHSGPDYPGYKETSLFYGREVPDRVQVGCNALAQPWPVRNGHFNALYMCSTSSNSEFMDKNGPEWRLNA